MGVRSSTLRSLVVVGLVAIVSSGCAWIQRVSVDSHGNQGSNYATEGTISGNGRYVAFESYNALVPDDRNDAIDVYVRDTAAGTTTRVSVTSWARRPTAAA